MRTKAATEKRRGRREDFRIVVTNSVYANVCRQSLRRLPAQSKSRCDLLTFSRWEEVSLPSRRVASTVFVSRFSDIPEESVARQWEGADARYLLFLEKLPVEAVASRLPRLNIRNPHRLHVAAEHDVRSISELVYRLLSGMAKESGAPAIVDAWIENEQLVVLSPSFDRLSVPLEKLAKFIGTAESKIKTFEIDEDGRFLRWPHADVHLGWKQLEQIVDPAAALGDKQKTAEFNRSYGAAIRSLREGTALKQSDIAGVTDRHLRRVEHGELPASKAMLVSLAEAHGMALEDYLKELANRLS